MQISVVINTYNRAESLRTTLEALRRQTYRNFEVVIVNGPSTDGTSELLASREGSLRVVDISERHLAKSRNRGIDAAAGDVVAFIDDDAVPEPRWLEDLAAAYADEGIGGAGGVVLDQTGVNLQYRYSVCSRIGLTNFDLLPPFDEYNVPGADPYLYLQGTNCSFRRDVLEAVGGFDEEIEYNYDESELCVEIIDAGYRLAPLSNAVVHHKFLPSHQRRGEGLFTDPFFPMKNRSYFALRVGAGRYPTATILSSLVKYQDELKDFAAETYRRGRFTQTEREHFLARLQLGFELGVQRGLNGERQSGRIATRQPATFMPYPTAQPPGRRLSIAFASLDYPPKPLGGVGRFTHDLARGMAAEGHDIHVVTRDDARPYTVDFEEGVWVHRFPVIDRWVPELQQHPLRGNLEHLASVYGAIAQVQRRFGVDVVSGNAWIAEPLFCSFDPRFETVMTCSTPMRVVAETEPVIAAQEHTGWQVRLEDAALREVAHLQPVSHANLQTISQVEGVSADKAEVIWHGIVDRRAQFPRRRAADDDAIELLFVGRLEPRKGIDTFLEASIRLLREDARLRVKLVGADSGWATGGTKYQEWLHTRLAREPELLPRFTFAGEIPDDELYASLADADVFCAPSRYESFGLVIGEAMMMGLPVVACRAGGMPELVVDDETGLLVAPGEADALHAALARLVADPELRAAMGRAGRDRYEREFRNEIAVERTLDFYHRLAEAHPGKPVASDVAMERVADHAALVLEELAALEPAAARRAARRLLDPLAFPYDYASGVRRALGVADPAACVAQLYEAILRRPADVDGLDNYVAALRSGRETRLDVVRAIATSDEARVKGVDRGFLDKLDIVDPTEILRAVRSVWTQPDELFARGLLRELEGAEPANADVEAIIGQLAAGRSRREILVAALEREAAARRVAAPGLLLSAELQTREELEAELRQLARRSPEEFVAGAYLLLLDRPADADGMAAFVHLLRGGGAPATVVRQLVDSDEARRRGLEPSWLEGLTDRVPRLRGDVLPGLSRLPGGRRVDGALRRAGLGRTRGRVDLRAIRAAVEVLRREQRRAGESITARLDQASHTQDRRLMNLLAMIETQRKELAALDARFDDRLARLEGASQRLDSHTQETLSRTGALDSRLDVLARKQEAVAMDLRERLPIQPSSDELPMPVIVDPERHAAVLESGEPVRVNLGCGEKPLRGYVNVDFRPLPGVDVVADVRRLPFEHGAVDELMSAHLVEHFRQHQLQTVLLPYWRSLLTPDGVLRIICPNWAVMIAQLNRGELAFADFKTVTFGLQDYSGDDHFAMYTPDSLSELLTSAGFDRIEVVTEHRQNGLSPEMEIVARVARDRVGEAAGHP